MEVSEARQTGCRMSVCVCVCCAVCICIRVYGLRACTEVGVSVHVCVCVGVSKIINPPQKRVIPLLCARADRKGPKEERKC